MSEQKKATLRAWFEESDRRKGLATELCTSTFVAHYPGYPSIDLKQFQPHLGTFYSAFPDLTQTVDHLVAEGDHVAFRVTTRGTNDGQFRGTPPTGKQIAVMQIGIARIEDGKVAEIWNVPDRLGLLEQLGLVPSAQQASVSDD